MIENKKFQFPNKVKKSTQLIILIAYLIMNRHTAMTKDALIDILWPNGISENPEGALRNLIYRARKELEPFCKDKKHSCILSKGNTYSWNNELPWDIDIQHLEQECAELEKEEDSSGMAERCQNLLDTYGMDFLHDFHEDWILEKRTYYRDMISRTLLHGCQSCHRDNRDTTILKIVEYAEFKQFYHPQLMEEKLQAFYDLKQYAQAITYYHKIVEMFNGTFNIGITPAIQEVYQELLKYHKEEPERIEDLIEDLNEDVNGKGAFYCDMDVFRSLYQVHVRASQRGVVSYLILVRLKVISKAQDNVLKRTGEQLKEMMYRNLRRNDVFCHCTAMSYGAIIETADQEMAQKALTRIKERFMACNADNNIQLLTDVKEIA